MRFSLLLLCLAACLAGGCASTDPDKFDAQLAKWTPLGTPLKKARQTMEGHGFDCQFVGKDSVFNPFGKDMLECEKFNQWFHTWNTRIFFENDKVTGYGSSSIE
jgi:hypothetical protein